MSAQKSASASIPGATAPDVRWSGLTDVEIRKGWPGWVGCEFTPSGHTLDSLAWGAAYGIRGR